MLHRKAIILPAKKQKLFISQINDTSHDYGYSIESKSVKVEMQDEFFLCFQIFNETRFKHAKIEYPKIWIQIDLLDENLEVYQSKFKIVKEPAIIIKKNKINLKKFNFRVILKQEEKVIDQATVFVV
jgi:hypothetical protein